VNNNQEMQFADPEWEPDKTQRSIQGEEMPPLQAPETFASAPTPPGSAGTAPPTGEADYNQEYAQGYRAQSAYTPPGPENVFQPGPQPQQQQFPYQSQQPQQPWYTRLPPWAWVLIVIALFSGAGRPAFSAGGALGAFWSLLVVAFIVFACWLLGTRRVTVNVSGEKQEPETHTFEVGAHPTIVINNKAGSIRLHAGEEHQVNITTTKRGYLFSQQWNLNRDSQVLYSQDKTNNLVSASVDSWKLFGKNSIDFDLAVPPQANLELVTSAGIIHVRDVAGEIKLRSEAGTIDATEVTLQGRSNLKTNAGSITLDAALDPAGDYDITTNLGTIDITLPASTSLNLDAKTDVGTVSTNLPISRQGHSQVGIRAFGQVGSGPSYPRLKARTNVGTITVNGR
jgi:Putative adhesin